MFHVMLVLPVLLAMLAVAGLILVGIAVVAAACIGGTSVAIFVKDRLVKKMLLLGFGIALAFGILCLLPLLASYVSLAVTFLTVAAWALLLLAALFGALGIRAAGGVANRTVAMVLKILFGIVLAAALVFAVTVGAAGFLLDIF